ncbi:MAG: accessory Sec system protein Asp3 [Lactobacillaceae bacterium]|jgi:accessory secretory protein Asp3|nr:accessory Sec system protein Asp3 [Lactobacillaceae bacterium]
MKLKEPQQFYWTNQTQMGTLYGAEVEFKALDEVHYRHPFYPNGATIVGWSSEANWNIRRVPELPELIPGNIYRITRHVQTNGITPYLSVSVYNDDHNRIIVEEHDLDTFTFNYPLNASSYKIELIGFGDGDFIFNSIELRPEIDEKSYFIQGDNSYSDFANQLHTFSFVADNHKQTARIVFSEPVYGRNNFPLDIVGPLSGSVLYFADTRVGAGLYSNLKNKNAYEKVVLDEINHFIKTGKFKKLQFIGSGPISSFAAVYFYSLLKDDKNESLITSDVFSNINDFLKLKPFLYYQSLAKFDSLKIDLKQANINYYYQSQDPKLDIKNYMVDYNSRLNLLPIADDALKSNYSKELYIQQQLDKQNKKTRLFWPFKKK